MVSRSRVERERLRSSVRSLDWIIRTWRTGCGSRLHLRVARISYSIPRWLGVPIAESRLVDGFRRRLIDVTGTISPRGGRRPEGNPVSRWLSVK
jgi:hypothetical protein